MKKLAHCLYAESARHTGTDWSRNYVSYPTGRVRRLTPLETERLQGFPDNWTMPKERSTTSTPWTRPGITPAATLYPCQWPNGLVTLITELAMAVEAQNSEGHE